MKKKDSKTHVKKVAPLRPKIVFSKDSWDDILTIINLNPITEVTFHGEICILPGNTFYIDRIHVFRQFVSAVHVELALDGPGTMSEFIEKLANGDEINGYEWNLSIDKCFNYPPKFFFHGHLHPGTLLEHSTTDDNGYLGIHEHLPYYIDGIFTRDGKSRFWFYGMGGFIKISDCKIKVNDDSQLNAKKRNERNALIAQMISERVIHASAQGGVHGNT